MPAAIQDLHRKVDLWRQKADDLENRSRRNNLRIRQRASYAQIKRRLRDLQIPYSIAYPARLRIVDDDRALFLTDPEEDLTYRCSQAEGKFVQDSSPSNRHECCLQSVISQLRVKTDDCDYCDFSGFGGHFIGVTTASETMWTCHSASAGSAYMNITPEEKLRRLAYCIKLLPSPLFKMERLMPTNPEAQKRFLIQEEEQPRPSLEKTERQERSLMMRELCKYLEEEKESTEEKTKIRRGKIQRVKTIKVKKFTRRNRIRQNTIRQYVDHHMRGKRNIIWTILLKPLCH
ncbi:uncharacterized protein LOC142760563 [Rhinoderma darwinii]|uniref:uncharacterized protein LOC142760563 n=1 Tax=Rhinoderma darwinii TaxID=43563 RepID=UPI003F67482E